MMNINLSICLFAFLYTISMLKSELFCEGEVRLYNVKYNLILPFWFLQKWIEERNLSSLRVVVPWPHHSGIFMFLDHHV